MQMIPVVSSNLKAIGYNQGTLFVTFHSGGTYAYFEVPEHIFNELLYANSKGTYHHRNIKNHYHYQKVNPS